MPSSCHAWPWLRFCVHTSFMSLLWPDRLHLLPITLCEYIVCVLLCVTLSYLVLPSLFSKRWEFPRLKTWRKLFAKLQSFVFGFFFSTECFSLYFCILAKTDFCLHFSSESCSWVLFSYQGCYIFVLQFIPIICFQSLLCRRASYPFSRSFGLSYESKSMMNSSPIAFSKPGT